jgi:hypothetical protein
MYRIFKITSSPAVDFAAEELKKYMRMMMPECGESFIAGDEAAALFKKFLADLGPRECEIQTCFDQYMMASALTVCSSPTPRPSYRWWSTIDRPLYRR